MKRLGCHLRIRNSWSMGYFSYLACVDAWRKIADQTVVVDGCSTDESVSKLLEWVENDPTVSVISNDISHWGEKFRIEQSLVNKQMGHDILDDFDWIIGLDADHVVDLSTTKNFLSELNDHFNNDLLVSFDVYYFYNGKFHKRSKPRSWIINNRLAKQKGIRIGWGIDNKTGPTDNPIIITGQESFIDPENGIEKIYYTGNALYDAPLCSIKVYRFGHFFFNKEQVIYKIRRWDSAISQRLSINPKSNLEALIDADVIGIRKFMSMCEIKKYDFPLEVTKIIDKVYYQGMLGGALYWGYSDYYKLFLRGIIKLSKFLDRIF